MFKLGSNFATVLSYVTKSWHIFVSGIMGVNCLCDSHQMRQRLNKNTILELKLNAQQKESFGD